VWVGFIGLFLVGLCGDWFGLVWIFTCAFCVRVWLAIEKA